MSFTRYQWLLTAISAAALCAQSPQPPTIRVTTRLVEINAIVRDRKGPIESLTKENFTVLDNGKPQKIAMFAMNSTHVPAKAPAPLPPNLYTNIPEARHEIIPSATVVLVDTLHTQTFDQPYAREQFIKFLKEIRPEDRVAVYALGRRLTILHDFTNDAGRLLAAVTNYKGSNEGVAEGSDPDSTDWNNPNFTFNGKDEFVDFASLTSGELTLAAIEAVSDHLSKMPGRKSLIWITDSIPLRIDMVTHLNHAAANPGVESVSGSQSLLAARTYRALQALNDANIAVYPVDARGLVGVPASMTAAGAQHAVRGQPINVSSMSVTMNHDSMLAIAKVTGGEAFYNTNDIKGAVRKAADDAEVTYTLGFYATSSESDTRFHELKVSVDRKGAEVRTRTGYQPRGETQTSEKERTELIRDALWSPIEASAIGLAARVEKSDSSWKVTLGVTPSDVQLDQKDGKWTGAVDYVLAQRSADGHFLNREPKAVALNLDKAQYTTMLTTGLTFSNTIQIDPKAMQLRIVLLDRVSGKVGSVNIPVKP